MEKKKEKAPSKVELNKKTVIAALIEAGIEKMGKERNVGVVVSEHLVEVYKNKEVHLRDDFRKRLSTPEEYAAFIVKLIETNIGS